MATLNLIRHPNILPILGSYRYQNTTSFLFPKAKDGSLEDMFKKPHGSTFRDEWRFFMALSGLASAVAHVHNFSERNLDLSLIGRHHDIKADNVLVSGDQFIMADFGLARFKSSSQRSSSDYKIRNGFAIAPECQDLEGSFQRHLVGRASDIWSFGCVMLKTLTYMRHGPEGLNEFEEIRRFGKEKKSNTGSTTKEQTRTLPSLHGSSI